MQTFDTTSGINYINLQTNKVIKPKNVTDHYHKGYFCRYIV